MYKDQLPQEVGTKFLRNLFKNEKLKRTVNKIGILKLQQDFYQRFLKTFKL